MTVLIVGAGIAGLSLGLTLHQIGVPFRIFEAVRQLRPLGVGINLQPNAVRELFDLGLEPDLTALGVATRSLGFYSKHGREIWSEPRGRAAGYDWPQLSVHRGNLQMLLAKTLKQRAGPGCLITGARAAGFETDKNKATLLLEDSTRHRGDLLVAADGIHSAIRRQMVPEEGPPLWEGAILWRGVTRMPPFLSGADMILAGHDHLRIVAYPITASDPETGEATVNWIAEKRVDPAKGYRREDWNRSADLAEFLPAFESWRWPWLDVPGMIRGADTVLEYPMVDRDPLPAWRQGRVTLMGDAAHPTYPVGSNGASQAIVDARAIGAAVLAHGPTTTALDAYAAEMRPLTHKVILANRGSGPDAILQRVEELCDGQFDRIEDVIPRADLADHAARYKALAGLGIEATNAAPPRIPRTQETIR